MLTVRSKRSTRRSGATLVESALVSGVALVLLLGIILGALTVHRYQQVAHAAREGARWASVRAADYQKETSNAAATQETIRTNGVLANAAGLDPNALTVTVTWSENDNRPYRTAMPVDEAREEILRGSGSHFDPTVAEAFLKISQGRLEEVTHHYETLTSSAPDVPAMAPSK